MVMVELDPSKGHYLKKPAATAGRTSGCRIEGQGFRFWDWDCGLGFRTGIEGLGSRIQGSGIGIEGLACRIKGLIPTLLNPRLRPWDLLRKGYGGVVAAGFWEAQSLLGFRV